jgi:hypothetical protein
MTEQAVAQRAAAAARYVMAFEAAPERQPRTTPSAGWIGR